MSDLWKFSLKNRNNGKNNSKMRAKRSHQSFLFFHNSFLQQQNQREIAEKEAPMKEEVELLQWNNMREGFDLQPLTDRVELPPFTEREDHGELFRHTDILWTTIDCEVVGAFKWKC